MNSKELSQVISGILVSLQRELITKGEAHKVMMSLLSKECWLKSEPNKCDITENGLGLIITKDEWLPVKPIEVENEDKD